MILASFSLDWFMTIPGMLITGGVVFLIIALIIFIVTGNKKPKTNKEVQAVQEASKQEAVATASQTVTPTPVVPTNNQVVTPQPVVTPEPVVPATPVNSMAEKSVKEEVEPAVFTATIPEDIAPQPVVQQSVPVVNPTVSPIVNNTTVSPTMPTPAVPTIEQTPVVNQPVVASIPVNEEKKETIQTPSVDMPRQIYGGASPIVPNVPHEEEHRQIYGGANPLENTQSVPIVPSRPVVTKEVKVEVPTVETPTVPVTPSVTSQVSNDIFASSSVAATPVNANPVVEPTVQSTVSQSQPEEIESLF